MSETKLNHIRKTSTFVNTREFCREALNFLKSGNNEDERYYISAPVGTGAHKDYWDIQEERCKNGYVVGGVRITGPHYFYLNFCRIKITVTEGKIERKIYSFPRFLDVDYHFFHEIEQAREQQQGLIVAKSRRKGFSFKTGALVAHQYTFSRNSISIIGAYLADYSNATMQMALEMLNFNDHKTDFGKNRLTDRQDHIISGFEENGVKLGFKSEIFRLTFKDNFSAAIGKTADVMLFEEAGKWPNLIDSYAVTAPVFRDGSIMTGQPIIFGTGGDMEAGSVDFAEMFYNPETYWLRAYENVWDEGGYGTSCGLFIDDMWYKPGKVLIPTHLKDQYTNESPGTEALLKHQTDHPDDMITVDGVDEDGNSHRCAAEIAIDRERKAQAAGLLGDLYWLGDEVKWSPNPNLYPVEKFPHKPDEDNTGCVVIWEQPYKNDNGEIPYGMYIAGTDPYDQDDSGTMSLGSTFIYKTFTKFDQTYNILVAEYTGRPNQASQNYEITRKLLEYYNAKTLYENQLKGLRIYFEQKKCLNLLKEQPAIISDMVKNSKVQRGYGIHMTSGIKTQCEIYARDWLLEERGERADGSKILNLHTIYSIPLLQELIAYNPKEGNYDRAIAFMVTILHSHENHKIVVQEQFKLKSKFNSGIFSDDRTMYKKRRW